MRQSTSRSLKSFDCHRIGTRLDSCSWQFYCRKMFSKTSTAQNFVLYKKQGDIEAFRLLTYSSDRPKLIWHIVFSVGAHVDENIQIAAILINGSQEKNGSKIIDLWLFCRCSVSFLFYFYCTRPAGRWLSKGRTCIARKDEGMSFIRATGKQSTQDCNSEWDSAGLLVNYDRVFDFLFIE